MNVETVKIVNPSTDRGWCIINAADFNASEHELYEVTETKTDMVEGMTLSDLRVALTDAGVKFTDKMKEAALRKKLRTAIADQTDL